MYYLVDIKKEPELIYKRSRNKADLLRWISKIYPSYITEDGYTHINERPTGKHLFRIKRGSV